MHNGENDNATRRIGGRVCFIAFFTLSALAIASYIIILYGEQAEKIYIGGDSLAFAPVYNRSGSWLHGRLKLGYRPDILFLEHVISLFLLLFLARFTDFISMIFGMSRRWSLCEDLAIAATLVRLINVILGRYTLDYIYVARWGTYDLVDFYLGISFLILCVWAVLGEIRMLRLKKYATQGMNFWQRVRWELVFTRNACRAAFISTAKWKEIQERYAYNFEKNEQTSA